MNRTYYEFFCGGGMARLGLGRNWTCLLANDIDPKKISTYEENFGRAGVRLDDIYKLDLSCMPGEPDLAWASFPCQDLSLAGNRGGLAAERSGTFWGFWRAIHALRTEKRAPRVLVLENVLGTLTSSGGADFREICGALVTLGYRFGALAMDAAQFLPQSRPRLFVVCLDASIELPSDQVGVGPIYPWHVDGIATAHKSLPSHLKSKWVWWNLPSVVPNKASLKDIVEVRDGLVWHSQMETSKLISMMSQTNRTKLSSLRGKVVYGTGYKRMRNEDGKRVQRFEVRFDGVAGCLRTPGGGSSRQILLEVKNGNVRTRLLTVREAARLMGVSDSYKIPANYNDGYHIFGDGLAVPVVAHLEQHLLRHLLSNTLSFAKVKAA